MPKAYQKKLMFGCISTMTIHLIFNAYVIVDSLKDIFFRFRYSKPINGFLVRYVFSYQLLVNNKWEVCMSTYNASNNKEIDVLFNK